LFVFKYAPGRRPCWDAAADLGGHAVFVGQNNAVSVRAEAVPGIKGNCVNWMCQYAHWCTSMEFDLQTRKSAPCVEWQEHAICWYLLGLGDVMASSKKELERGDSPARTETHGARSVVGARAPELLCFIFS
jgi:hypothetical protein